MSFSSRTIFVATLFISILTQVICHSYLTSPISRSNQAETQTGCRGPTCFGPCDIPLSKAKRAPIIAARGDHIVVNWPRNNHAGGFVRFAWAPTSLSDLHSAFDSHVQQISCHEMGNNFPGGCLAADPINDPNGAGSGPTDGSYGACTTNISVPTDLTDGKWTLQWAWFGGAFALGDYYSCVDYSISGGASIAPIIPVFKGGDVTYPGQNKCKFFNTNQLHVCINEPCTNPLFNGEQSGRPADNQLGNIVNIPSGSSSSSSSSSSTSGIAQTVTSNTPVIQVPATTGRPQLMTTSRRPVSTTSSIQSSTTQQIEPSKPNIVPSSCSSANRMSLSTASIQSVESWGNQFHMTINVVVGESTLTNWVVAISLPTSSFQVNRFFNAGVLKCKEDNIAYFSPAAVWANNLSIGATFQVEFIGSVSGDADVNSMLTSIKSNSRASVFIN